MASVDELLAPIINDNNNETPKLEENNTSTQLVELDTVIESNSTPNGDLNENLNKNDTKDCTTDAVDTVDGPSFTNGPSLNSETDALTSSIDVLLDSMDTEMDKEASSVEEITSKSEPMSDTTTTDQPEQNPLPILFDEPKTPAINESISISASEEDSSGMESEFDKSISPIEIAENVINDIEGDDGDDEEEDGDNDNSIAPVNVDLVSGGSDDNNDAAINNYHPTENGLQSDESQPSDVICKLCQNKFVSPRVLTCLHVFCGGCIEQIIVDATPENSLKKCLTVNCPICKQLTKLGEKGLAALHDNYILTNILDITTIDPSLLACTSCKSKDTAISRCNNCANFLCAGCDNAHQYMRCFEDHKVVRLDDMRGSTEKIAIHKPLFCKVHISENLKHFCFNCQVPICNDCLLTDHKGAEHHHESISDAEKRMRKEVEGLMMENRTKFEYCEMTASSLNNSLQELQQQHDTARDLITDTYQTFKDILDKCRDNAYSELTKLHSDRELKIMDLSHNVEESAERIEYACRFAKSVLDQANGPEFLSLKKMISSQLLNLIHTIPKADARYSVQFMTKNDKFEQIIREAFGKFRTESSPPSPKESTPPPTLPGMPPAHKSGHNGALNNSQSALTGSVTASSPISLPTSMQSSFDGDISALSSGFMMPPNVLTPDSSAHSPQIQTQTQQSPPTPNFPPPTPGSLVGPPPPLTGLSSIAEYNLHRLANIAETTVPDMPEPMVQQPPPPPATSAQYTIADLISGDQNAFNTLQALSKIGLGPHDYGVPPPVPRGLGQNPSPVSLLNDYMNPLGAATSPILSNPGQLSSLNEDMCVNQFPTQVGVPGRTKAAPMHIRCKFGSLGPSKGQFNAPHGFCLGLDEEIIVADTNNHRIQIFDKDGTFKFQFGVPGKDEGQLWYPRKVAVMRTNSRFVVCDRGNERSRMQIFTKNGHFMKKIAIRYIDIVAGLAVTANGQIVAVDSVSPTVFIISEEGELLHWFDCSDYMREPSDIAINGNEFYVCDFKGHCVAVFSEQGKFMYRIGNEKVTCFPNGIDISDAGDILIGDSHGNRFHVACYSREGILQSEFECPHVKVSRCCGLKITSEGYVVTLAKNNHHVLVLNTLYIQ